MEDTDRNRRLRVLHLASGGLIAAFLLVHLANHLAMFAGQAAHIAVMEHVRPLYRNGVVEPLLMVALIFQIGTGLTMIWRTRTTRAGWLAWLQAGSGVVLALFLVNHVVSVWAGRLTLGLDTNYHFAAAGFHAGLSAFFAPYYLAGVAALFVHLACALAWRMRSRTIPALLAIGGIALAIGFVATMWSDPAIPQSYRDTYL